MSIQNVNFQGNVPRREKRNNTIISAIGAPIIATANFACDILFDKSLKKDTFTKTAKECIKHHTKNYKDVAAGLFKRIGKENWANAINKIKNNDKRLAIGVFALETAAFFGLFKLVNDMASKFRHRHDY